jgi:hypothetical protein
MRKLDERAAPTPFSDADKAKRAYNPPRRVFEPSQTAGGSVKNLAILLVSLTFAADGFAQTPAQAPVQVAQAGGAAQGAALPATSTGATSTIAAVVAVGVAGVAAVTAYSSTTSSH